jgi:hypothetical protein
MLDDERLEALLLLLAIGWIYHIAAGCKDLSSLPWKSAWGIRLRFNASDPRVPDRTS